MKKKLENMKSLFEQSDAEKKKIHQDYIRDLEAFRLALDDAEERIQKVFQEKRDILLELDQCKQELNQERVRHQETQHLLFLSQKKIQSLETQSHLIKSLEAQANELHAYLNENKLEKLE